MARNLKQGETVNLVAFLVMTSGTPQAIPIFDANAHLRPLQSYERLVIDELTGMGNYSVGTDTTHFYASTATGSTVTSTSLVAVFDNSGFGPFHFTGGAEGFALPVGAILAAWPYGNSTSSTAPSRLVMTGTGRIVEGTTQGIRPSWRESMVRGD